MVEGSYKKTVINKRENMSATRVNVILFGVGNIGSELLSQVIESQRFFLEKRNIDLRFPIITNSTIAFFEEEGMKNKWEADFTKWAVPYQFQDILDYVRKKKLDNLIAVDATASSEIIKNYIPLIQNGFNIVAANKKANTLHIDFYKELRRVLKKHDKEFLYEATVGAGLPVIKTIRDLHFSGEKITKIRGVFSGSLSYIFNRFSNEEEYFSAILKDAEKLGLTEPDSREDLAGNDVARKLLILAREIENEFDFSDVKIVSLLLPNLNENSSKADYARNKSLLDKPFRLAKLAQAENNVLRYVAELDITKKKLEVKPVSVSRDSVIGQLKGADNLVEIYTKNNITPIVIQGAGAGRQVTARRVLSDILELAEKIKIKETVLELI
ncbi:aspartokinase [Flavobacterium palustre]|uniref:Homoserine dehydrogenase n=2 Tax=Flavobacterium palustre TaxID=1476463 RepID=A0ABQ1HQ21_9FLAO|nr:aspartokinase [Flavobacterium palustre]